MTARRPFLKLAFLTLAMFSGVPLTGCIATAPLVPQMTPDDVAAGKDMMLLRISVKGLKFIEGLSLIARPMPGGEPIQIPVWSPRSEGYWGTFYDDVEKGALVAMTLPAGNYEFFTFAASAGSWGGGRWVKPTKEFSMPFRIEKGESVYLGHLLLDFKNDSGLSSRYEGLLPISDQKKLKFSTFVQDTRVRDFKEIATRLPNVDLSRVKIRLLK